MASVSTSPEGPGRCKYIRKACLIVIIELGNVLNSNNVEYVSKRSFSHCIQNGADAPLLDDILITPLSGHTERHNDVTI